MLFFPNASNKFMLSLHECGGKMSLIVMKVFYLLTLYCFNFGFCYKLLLFRLVIFRNDMQYVKTYTNFMMQFQVNDYNVFQGEEAMFLSLF